MYLNVRQNKTIFIFTSFVHQINDGANVKIDSDNKYLLTFYVISYSKTIKSLERTSIKAIHKLYSKLTNHNEKKLK